VTEASRTLARTATLGICVLILWCARRCRWPPWFPKQQAHLVFGSKFGGIWPDPPPKDTAKNKRRGRGIYEAVDVGGVLCRSAGVGALRFGLIGALCGWDGLWSRGELVDVEVCELDI